MSKASKNSPVVESDGDGSVKRQNRIAEMAYYMAEKRGFQPGMEMADWLIAENLLPAAE